MRTNHPSTPSRPTSPPSRLGVCSWSLQPASPADLVDKVRACGLAAVQLALDPITHGQWSEPATTQALRDAGITILSGMIGFQGEDYSTLDTIRLTGGVRPDADWPANFESTKRAAAIATRLGLRLVTFHAGFIPHERADPLRTVMLDRLRAIADIFAEHRIRIAFETGQETAETLLDALAELARPSVSVNFDPANMILYGMGDPIASLIRLANAGRIAQVHIKDAFPTVAPGTWGQEVASGTGRVDWPAFFGVLRSTGQDCNLLIEREAGDQRIADIRAAAAVVNKHAHLAPTP